MILDAIQHFHGEQWYRVCRDSSFEGNLLWRCNAIQLVIEHFDRDTKNQLDDMLALLARLFVRPGGVDSRRSDTSSDS